MILALTLPPGWTRVPAAAPPGGGGDGGELIWPPAESALEGKAERGPGSLLLLSPLMPLPRSLPILIEQALAGESDYRIAERGALLLPRLGPWEAVVLLTRGRSAETGVESSRIYAALDVGYGAFLLVFIECRHSRIGERQEQLYALIRKARLRKKAAKPRRSRSSPEPLSSQPAKPATRRRAAAPPSSPSLTPAAVAPASEPTEGADTDIPPQRPPAEIYLKDTLYRHLID